MTDAKNEPQAAQDVRTLAEGLIDWIENDRNYDVKLEVTETKLRDFCERAEVRQAGDLLALKAIIARCHEALGEDAGSDDETLPEGIAALRSEVERLRRGR